MFDDHARNSSLENSSFDLSESIHIVPSTSLDETQLHAQYQRIFDLFALILRLITDTVVYRALMDKFSG